jgi:hypothetical protein
MDKVYNNFLSFEYKPTQKKFVQNLSINVNITTTTTAVGTTDSEITTTSSNYKRFFISLMSESLIKKGVFFRLRKRLRVKKDIFMYMFFFFYWIKHRVFRWSLGYAGDRWKNGVHLVAAADSCHAF